MKTTLLLASLLSATPAFAQQVIPPTRTLLLDAKFEKTTVEGQARYRREIVFADSVGGEIRDYFFPSGQKYTIGQYAHVDKRVLHGSCDTWYASGQLMWHEEFAQGQREGERRLYYPSGQLKRREIYTLDQRGLGECYAPDGRPLPYFEYQITPVYSEGDGSQRAISAAVARRTEYPAAARRAGQEGRVLVSFVVTRKGRVTDIQVKQHVSPLLDEAAVAAVRRLANFTPGRQDGEPVAVAFTVPISFRLEADSSVKP